MLVLNCRYWWMVAFSFPSIAIILQEDYDYVRFIWTSMLCIFSLLFIFYWNTWKILIVYINKFFSYNIVLVCWSDDSFVPLDCSTKNSNMERVKLLISSVSLCNTLHVWRIIIVKYWCATAYHNSCNSNN